MDWLGNRYLWAIIDWVPSSIFKNWKKLRIEKRNLKKNLYIILYNALSKKNYEIFLKYVCLSVIFHG